MGKLAARLFYNQTGKRFPVYLLNVPALFGGIVGQTEANVRWVTETLSAQGHYMLVIDELEKMLATGGYNGDSGVSLRAVGQILTWLAERVNNPNDKGYIIGTLNTIEGIRPEFFRRFDAVFATDLPTPDVRKEIIASHFQRRGVDIDKIVGANGMPLTPGGLGRPHRRHRELHRFRAGGRRHPVPGQGRLRARYDDPDLRGDREDDPRPGPEHRGQDPQATRSQRSASTARRRRGRSTSRSIATPAKGALKRSRQVNTGE